MGIGLGYEEFNIPPGATLHHYSPDKKQVFGAYTQANKRSTGRFMTGISTGDMAVIEYYEPQSVRGKGSFKISNVYFVYKSEGLLDQGPAQANITGFGASFPCQINVKRPQGADWHGEGPAQKSYGVSNFLSESPTYKDKWNPIQRQRP